jgi:hypothetical protein
MVLVVAAIPASHGFSSAGVLPLSCSTRAARCPGSRSLAPALGLRMQVESKDKPAADVEKTVEKYGLEAGVFKALTFVPSLKVQPGFRVSRWRLGCLPAQMHGTSRTLS